MENASILNDFTATFTYSGNLSSLSYNDSKFWCISDNTFYFSIDEFSSHSEMYFEVAWLSLICKLLESLYTALFFLLIS